MDSPRTPSNTADAQAVATLQQLQQQSPHQEQQQQQSTCGQQVALCAVRDWRFNKAAEDVEWLLTWSSGDGTLVTSSWQVLYSISHAATWAQLQRFLLPRLTRVRGWCQGGAASGPGSLAEGLYRPTPHAFQPWSRDAVLDWRYSRTRGQLLFLVRRCSPATNALMGDEWCEMCVGNLSMWLLVKNYLLQVLLLEAAYLAPPALPSPPTPEAAGAVDAASPVAGSNSPMIPAAGAGEGASPSSVAAAGSLSSGAGPWAQPCVPEGPWSHASQQQKQQQQQQQQQQQEEEVADPQSRQQLDVGEVGQQQQQQQQPLTLAARSPTDQQPAAPMVQEPGLEAAAAAPGAQYCPPLWGWLPPGGLPPPGWPSLTCPLPILPVYPPQQQLPGGSSPQALPWTYDATAAAAAAMATGSDPRLQLSGPALPCACEPMGASAAAFLGSPYASNTALVAAAAAAAAAVLAGYGGIALGRSGLGPDASSSRAATATQVLLGGPPTSMAADTALAPPAMTRDGRFSMDGYTCPSASAALGGGEGWVRWESTEQLPGTLPCPGPSAAPEGAWPSSSGAGGGVCEALAQPSCAHSH